MSERAELAEPDEPVQLAQVRAWLDGEQHADHDTFAMGRGFAEALVDAIDRVVKDNKRMWNAMQRAANHPERWLSELSVALDSTRGGVWEHPPAVVSSHDTFGNEPPCNSVHLGPVVDGG